MPSRRNAAAVASFSGGVWNDQGITTNRGQALAKSPCGTAAASGSSWPIAGVTVNSSSGIQNRCNGMALSVYEKAGRLQIGRPANTIAKGETLHKRGCFRP